MKYLASLAPWLCLTLAVPTGLQAQTPPAKPDPLVAKGRIVFLQCGSCHEVAARGLVKIGPTLQGLLGRPVASVAGFDYSAALKAQTFAWDAEHLDRWLEQPTKLVPGTSMAYIGLPDATQRKALIAYLATLK